MRLRSLAPKTPDSTHILAAWLFVRILGLSHFFAFVALGLQIEGLLGSNGILPASRYLARVSAQLGAEAAWWVPSVFWLSASDGALVAACWAGAAVAVALTVGVLERWSLAVLWLLYLSLCSVGQSFLAFQWDALLLEASVAGLLVTSGRVFCGLRNRPDPSWLAQLALRILLVKLVFSSGWGKLASGDPHWRDLTAMAYHYETQPLPTWIGWWAHQLPDWWHRVEVAGVFVIQLGVAPVALTPWRRWAFLPLVGLQILIAATGNYCFFNLLAVGLCAWLLSDDDWLRRLPRRLADRVAAGLGPRSRPTRLGRVAPVAVAALSSLPLALTTVPSAVPAPLEAVNASLRPLRSFNAYGLFAVMTTERLEVEVQGSRDGQQWRAYTFVAKPGPVDRAPAFIAPLHPRLDWQLWFAALGTPRSNPWVASLMAGLLEGSPQVQALFERVPFEAPPRWVRAVRFRYRFTDLDERRRSGAWWRRERLGEYFPAVSLSERVSEAP